LTNNSHTADNLVGGGMGVAVTPDRDLVGVLLQDLIRERVPVPLVGEVPIIGGVESVEAWGSVRDNNDSAFKSLETVF
jgi:hypothetical protein